MGSDADTVKNVIELFCLENMDYSAHSEESVAQLKDLGFEGKWIADMSPFGEAYADAEPCMTRKRPRPDLYEWPADPGL